MFDETEVRVTDPETGGQKGQKQARFDLLPVGALWEVARHFGVGAAKYDDNNWRRGYAWSLSYAAMQRHANLFWEGETNDEETGTHHLAAVAFHALVLIQNDMDGNGTDDRWSTVSAAEEEGGEPPSLMDMVRESIDEAGRHRARQREEQARRTLWGWPGFDQFHPHGYFG